MTPFATATFAQQNLDHVLDPDLSFEQALQICEFALKLDPHNLNAFTQGAFVHEKHRRLAQAGPWLDRALRYHPNNELLLQARILVAGFEGQADLALAYTERLRALNPNYDPMGYSLSNLLVSSGQPQRAVEKFRAIIEEIHRNNTLDPDDLSIFHHFGDALLKVGNADGFLHYSNILGTPFGAYYDVPGITWWAGHDIRGMRCLLTHQLGFGDQFLFCAIIPYLRSLGCEIVVTLDHAVHELLGPVLGESTTHALIRPFFRAVPAPEELQAISDAFQPDIQATLLHLPLIAKKYGLAAQDFFKPYVTVPQATNISMEAELNQIRERAGNRKIVGVAWDCIQRHLADVHGDGAACHAKLRSVPTTQIKQLTDAPEIAENYYFVSLVHPSHYQYFADELPENMDHVLHRKRTYSETASLIAICDLVIAVDASVANLACMQGKNTWIALHHRSEWRWGLISNTSPWLAHTRLFRQPVPWDWTSVMKQIHQALITEAGNDAISCVVGTIEESHHATNL